MTRTAFPIVPYKAKDCAACGSSFTPRRHDQKHCNKLCETAAKNRAAGRATQAYRAMYHWILASGAKERGEAMMVVSTLARGWRDEDRANGKPPPPLPEIMQTRRNNQRRTVT